VWNLQLRALNFILLPAETISAAAVVDNSNNTIDSSCSKNDSLFND
jgi:hypothetical protein